MAKTDDILSAVVKEMKVSPPKQLAKTSEKFGAADAKRQRTAILLNKARKAGARIPRP